jgi:hypothetical protein
MDCLLVLTGVSGPADLLAAPVERRPTFVATDLSGLFGAAGDARLPLPQSEAGGRQVGRDGDRATLGQTEAGGWRVGRDGDRATLDGDGDPVVALRLLCGVTWNGVPVSGLEAVSPAATTLFATWGR